MARCVKPDGTLEKELLAFEGPADAMGPHGAEAAFPVAADGDTIVATVGSLGDLKYAAIQEYGGKTSAHEILPDKAKALAFAAGGAMRFATRVEHPGSTIPGRSYLRATLEEQSDAIVAALAATPQESWERA